MAMLSGNLLPGATLTPISSCTIDGSPAPCSDTSDDFVSTPFIFSGFGGNILQLSLRAEARTGESGSPSSASAEAELIFDAYTTGPIRPGFASFEVVTFGNKTKDGSGSASASIEGLVSCDTPPDCGQKGSGEFTLGVPFQIRMFVHADGKFDPLNPGVGLGTSFINLTLSDPDGPDPIILPVPEPNQFGPALAAALAGIFGTVRARRKPRLQ
jgi:hypothetical protein